MTDSPQIRHRGVLLPTPGGPNLPDRLQQLGARERIGWTFRHRYHGFSSRLPGHLSLLGKVLVGSSFIMLPKSLPEEQYSSAVAEQNHRVFGAVACRWAPVLIFPGRRFWTRLG